jgi:hypothetical protein
MRRINKGLGIRERGLGLGKPSLIETKYKFNSGEKTIQVFVMGEKKRMFHLSKEKTKICADGEYIADDKF